MAYNIYYGGTGNWEIVPGDEDSNCFETEEAAWEMVDGVDGLRAISYEWDECEYDVRECTHPRHS